MALARTRCSPASSSVASSRSPAIMTNFSMAYSSHISWQNPDSPVPMEVYPSLAFDSLFENRGNKRTQSILDRVKDDLSSLCREIGSEDNRRLDEYLTSVREVEKR